jgi:hypothetical protein
MISSLPYIYDNENKLDCRYTCYCDLGCGKSLLLWDARLLPSQRRAVAVVAPSSSYSTHRPQR